MSTDPPAPPPWGPPPPPPGGAFPPPSGPLPPPGGFGPPLAPPLAGLGARFGAGVLDTLIALATIGVLGGVAVGLEKAGVPGPGLPLLIAFPLAALYPPLFLRRPGPHNGQTLGKQVAGIRVVRADGRPMDLGTALLREVVLRFLPAVILSGLSGLIDGAFVLARDDRRSVHDLGAGTYVVVAEAWAPEPT